MDFFLAALSALVCVGLPALLIGLPVTLFAVRTARRRPGRTGVVALVAALLNAGLVGASLALLGFAFGASIGDETAGAIAVSLASTGCVGGSIVSFVATTVWVRRASRAEVAAVSPRDAASANRALGCAAFALVAGVGTSLVGMVLSLSAGMLSLAFAQVAVRPLAACFVGLHLLTAAIALRARGRSAADVRGRADAAVAVSVAGVALAALIAAFGPGFYDWALGALADGATFVH